MGTTQDGGFSVTAEQVVSKSFSTDYVHHTRYVQPGPDFILPDIRLKWYEIHRPEVELPVGLSDESRQFIKEEVEAGRLPLANESGFVMLHLGDEPSSRNTFAMLFVCTWRYGNELWRTLYTKSLISSQEYSRPDESVQMGAFCVWELGAVWHERQSWSQFLYSDRDRAALDHYLNDKFEGPV